VSIFSHSATNKEQKELSTTIVNLIDSAARKDGNLSSAFSIICPKNSFDGTIVLNHVGYDLNTKFNGTLLINKPESIYNGELTSLIPEVTNEDDFFSDKDFIAIGETFTFSMPKGHIYISVWKSGKITVQSQILGEDESPKIKCKLGMVD
ncbi:hypothetical protein, partial [Pantoea sp. F_7]